MRTGLEAVILALAAAAAEDDGDDALDVRDLAAKLKITLATAYSYQARGRFARFELVPRIGPRRYSRKAVQAYLDREPTPAAAPRLRAVR